MKKTFYRRKLPHYHPGSSAFFITYRLAGSISNETIKRLQEAHQMSLHEITTHFAEKQDIKLAQYDVQKRYFDSIDTALGKNLNEPHWLKEKAIAEIIAESLHFLHEKSIKLWCFCIMPNHVHVLLSLRDKEINSFSVIQRHKTFTARKANLLLHRSGKFWEAESYDHVVREGEFDRIISYILNNPVKAGFVNEWEEWEWSYLNAILK